MLVKLLGIYSARRCAEVKNVDGPFENLAPALNGFTIVQISDIHVGPTIKCHYIEKIVAAVNALSTDLIALTGDVVEPGGSFDEQLLHVRELWNPSFYHSLTA